jgi:nickel superoxide dismutase
MSRITLFSVTALAAAAVTLAATPRASAHCQVPCGIYDDHNRVHRMREDVVTITKAVKQIKALAGKRDAKSQNQLVRWVVTKEQHAEKIIRVVSDYFLAQKIKPGNPKVKRDWGAYVKKLASHHKVMVAAMKCKQTAEPAKVKALSKAIDGIAGFWPKK